jgi:p-hydroxybenzoate 3-monooxygenase
MNEGPILQKGVTAMRSFVTEPMQFDRLFLAGDAAHIVPPTGAKGMNLALHDVWVLSEALKDFYRAHSSAKLDGYSEKCLKRIWRSQHFSWWMTAMLHNFPDASAYDGRRQLAELELVTTSEAGARFLAQNYTGAPFV